MGQTQHATDETTIADLEARIERLETVLIAICGATTIIAKAE